MKRLFDGIFQAIFWLWNLTFLLVVYAGIMPAIAPALISATFAGEIPLEFLFTFVNIIAVPTVCTFIGLLRFRQQPVKLMRLFYGVEAPLFLLCLIRLFLLRELTPASALIIGTVVVCIVAFFVQLLYGYAHRHRLAAWLQMITHSLMLLAGLYIGAVLMFYAVPTVAILLREFFSFEWLGWLKYLFTLESIWTIPTVFVLFIFSATLFVAMPSALATLYILSGQQILRIFGSQYGRKRAWVGAGAVVTAWIVIFISLQQQPQVQAFNLLKNPANEQNRQALLAKSKVIKDGLTNAYLLSYRYLSTKKENNHIQYIYSNNLGLPQSAARGLQESYNFLMSPFLYQGDRTDKDKAEKLYAQFFDAPIQKAERGAIQHALQSTVNRDEAKAGLLNINQEKVWLNTQQVTVTEHGDWADIELYEVYENQTPQVQEVFYSFSLPESAVITGLWLGDTNKLGDRFPFVVAPRGAAQQVYNDQVRQRVDPALLEQVGPRQYRLRAFPIPVRSTPQRAESSQPQQPQEMHLWLTYKVMQQQAGWALPQLAEKRNIFWNDDTKRIYKGAEEQKTDSWLPQFIGASRQYQPSLHEVNLSEGYKISAKPLTQQDYLLPQGKRLAILLDTSRSMAVHSKEISQAFAQLKVNANDVDLYLTASAGSQPKRLNNLNSFNLAKMTFYGTLQPKEMLRQFTQLRDNTAYDAVLVVTDKGTYELSNDKNDLPKMSAPLWMVHLGGQLPQAYDDATLKAIQDSGGGVSTQVAEVLQRLATEAKLGSSVVDGYAWSESTKFNRLEKTEPKATLSSQSQASEQTGFEQLAARQLILGLSKDTTALSKLDHIHAIAKTFDIVTPYSSMLVLVNDQQREALKRAEAQSDRFKREVESGQEELSQPFNPFTVSAVPEPEEWMLIGMVAIALIFLARRKRITVS